MKQKRSNKRWFYSLRTIYKLGIPKALEIWAKKMKARDLYHFNFRNRKIYIRKNSSDFSVFQQVFIFGHYDSDIFKHLQVNTIVDLGSNNGLTALHFKMLYPNSTLIAVEPAKNNYEVLLKNISHLPGVHCLNNAIWSSATLLNLMDPESGEAAYRVDEGNSGSKIVNSTKSITLDQIIDNYNLEVIDILKIDIECSEKELFSFGYQSWLPKVRCIIIELHDWIQPGCASSFFSAIQDLNYTFSYVGENVVILFDQKPYKPVSREFVNSRESSAVKGLVKQ